MIVAEFVRQLIDNLNWKKSLLTNKIQSLYLDYLIAQSEHTIEEIHTNDPQFSEALEILLSRLDYQTRKHFITSAIFASLVIMPNSLRDSGKRQFILKMLMKKVEGEINSNLTPLLNCHFDNAKSKAPLVILDNLLDNNLASDKTQKILFDENFPIPGIDRGGSNFSSIKDERILSIVVEKIQDAFLILKSTKTARDFTLQNTEFILIRKENKFPDVFSSGSFRLMPGLSLLCNTELASVSPYKVANALLHEAIHAIIYKYEALGQRLIPKEYENSSPIKSPWTGRLLNPNSFIQACFVWFGLYMFWASHEIGNSESDKQLKAAKVGFLSPVFQKSCEDIHKRLSLGIGEHIANLADLVKHNNYY